MSGLRVSAMERLAELVAFGLNHEVAGQPTSLTNLAQGLTQEVAALSVSQRVLPLVLPLFLMQGFPEELVRGLSALRTEQKRASLRIAIDQHAVVDVLEASQIRVLSVKGVCLAQLTTGDMTSRGAGDIDLLIAQPTLVKSWRELEQCGILPLPGYCPSPDSPLLGRVMRIKSEAVFAVGFHHVDLHWRLDPAEGGLRWTFDELWDRRVQVDVGGRFLNTLNATDSAVFNAANGARDSWSTLRHIVDQVRLLRLIDPSEARQRAHDVGALRRWDLASALASKLTGAPADVGPRARKNADRMWDWLMNGKAPGVRGGLGSASRRFVANAGLYDDFKAALRRLEVHAWPLDEMGRRSLGEHGDEHPWLYAVASPVFLARRAAKVILLS